MSYSIESAEYRPLGPEGRLCLARALGDTPETAMAVHTLRRGFCEAWAAGPPDRPGAAVVQLSFRPGEPYGWGDDPRVLWDVLCCVDGWECVNVAAPIMLALEDVMRVHMECDVRVHGEIYHTLSRPVHPCSHSVVRMLSEADAELLANSDPEVSQNAFGGVRRLLQQGGVAAAVIAGHVVAIAQTYALTARHAEIGAVTLPPWRNRGFATAAASLVARWAQENGRTPVWSTAEDNYASLRVAEKLGFQEVSRRAYLIPQRASHGA